MGITSLYAGNKNQFRKYPIKQGMSFLADNGTVAPDDLIVNCSITTVYGNHRLYIRQIYHNGVSTRITIASVINDLVLGMFYGDVTEDFTTLTFIPFVRYISGSLTIGSASSLASIAHTLHFTKETSELEESTIFCYTHPAVTSVSDKKRTELRGDVNFGTLTNIKKSKPIVGNTAITKFKVTNPSSVFNLADTSTFLENCPNPIIKKINGVLPYPVGGDTNLPENDGNIYIVGVNPIVFYGVPAAIAVEDIVVGTGITPNTVITSGEGNAWTVSVNQTATANIEAAILRPTWRGDVYISGSTLTIKFSATPTSSPAIGDLVAGVGIAQNTHITGGSEDSWTVSVSQTVGSLASPVRAAAYQGSWSGTLSTTNGSKDLTIIATTSDTATPKGVPGVIKTQTAGVTLESLCVQKHKLLPPVDICGFTNSNLPNTYYSKPALAAVGAGVCSDRPARNDGSYYSTTYPEYYFWPQFVKPGDYEKYWNTLY